MTDPTQVSIANGRWHINGEVTCRGAKAEGLLLNVRVVNANFEDAKRPDFDPETNTEESIAQIPDYVAHGIRASTSGLGDGSAHASVAQVSDFLLVHFNSTRLEDIPKRIASLKRYGKPIVCNEDAKEGAEGAEAAELCVPNGASWGFLLEKLNPQMFSHGWELPSRLTGEGGRSGEWAFDEYLRRACATAEQKPKP